MTCGGANSGALGATKGSAVSWPITAQRISQVPAGQTTVLNVTSTRAPVLRRLPSSWTSTRPCGESPRRQVWPDRVKPSRLSRGLRQVRTTCARRC